jgi:hypothetical protein
LPRQLANRTRAHPAPASRPLNPGRCRPGLSGVLARLSPCCPPARGRLHTRCAPVRRWCCHPLDLHVLGPPLAFILSQDQTLHCKKLQSAPKGRPKGLACRALPGARRRRPPPAFPVRHPFKVPARRPPPPDRGPKPAPQPPAPFPQTKPGRKVANPFPNFQHPGPTFFSLFFSPTSLRALTGHKSATTKINPQGGGATFFKKKRGKGPTRWKPMGKIFRKGSPKRRGGREKSLKRPVAAVGAGNAGRPRAVGRAWSHPGPEAPGRKRPATGGGLALICPHRGKPAVGGWNGARTPS